MIGGIIIIILTGVFAMGLVDQLKIRYPFIDASLLKRLFYFHVALSIAYYLYVLFNPTDSRAYYNSTFETDDWFSLYGTSTTFIKFIAYPLVRFLAFSYEACMALFSFLGYLGFVYSYIFFRERVRFTHTFLNYDLMTLLFYLPNLHFWSGSLGKGSVIFLGIGLYFYGLSHARSRWLAMIIGGLFIYHVRPHIMLVVLVSSVIGFMFSTKGVSPAVKVFFLLGAGLAFFFIYKDVLSLVGINEDEFITQGLDLTHRASELSKATSGVDINNYSLPMQVFTFLFRPLFFDAPGALGIIVSVENVFYLFMAAKLVGMRAITFLIKGNFMVKSAFLSFITVTIALAQISGNLGLAIRQKSQVMMLLMFVILMFLDEQKHEAVRQRKAAAARALSRQTL